MSEEEANGTVTVWAVQFTDIPVDLVMIAINKIISNSPFPPAISEVKEKIKSLYWEVWEILNCNNIFKTLTDEQEVKYRKLFDILGSIRNDSNTEPTIRELVEGGNYNNLKFLQGD
jgi:hypothetical protein